MDYQQIDSGIYWVKEKDICPVEWIRFGGKEMVQDLELIQDISPLFEECTVIWGAGFFGQGIFQQLQEMLGRKRDEAENILFVDSDEKKWGKYDGYEVKAPKSLKTLQQPYHIIISVNDLEVQDEIIEEIKEDIGEEVVVYTKYAFETSICLNLRYSKMSEKFMKAKLAQRKEDKYHLEQIGKLKRENELLKYLAFALMHNEMILIYQPGKVGSTSLKAAIESRGKYVLHLHAINEFGLNHGEIKEILQKYQARIITMVREPVSRYVSDLWENILNFKRCAKIDADFNEIEDSALHNWANYEFDWFDRELKNVLGIDIYQYDFDTEKGYSIIEQDGISVLLLKTEKMNQLMHVVGKFIGCSNFKLSKNQNVGSKKPYRYAYEAYKRDFKLSKGALEKWYQGNERVNHFWSPGEQEEYLRQWDYYAVDEMGGMDVK